MSRQRKHTIIREVDMEEIFSKQELERLLTLPKEELNKLKMQGENRGYFFDEETNDKMAAIEERIKRETGKEFKF